MSDTVTMQRFQANSLFSVLFQEGFQNKNLQTKKTYPNDQKQKQNQGNNTSIKNTSKIFNFGNFKFLQTLGIMIFTLVFFNLFLGSNAQAGDLVSSGPTIVISDNSPVTAALVGNDQNSPPEADQPLAEKLKLKAGSPDGKAIEDPRSRQSRGLSIKSEQSRDSKLVNLTRWRAPQLSSRHGMLMVLVDYWHWMMWRIP